MYLHSPSPGGVSGAAGCRCVCSKRCGQISINSMAVNDPPSWIRSHRGSVRNVWCVDRRTSIRVDRDCSKGMHARRKIPTGREALAWLGGRTTGGWRDTAHSGHRDTKGGFAVELTCSLKTWASHHRIRRCGARNSPQVFEKVAQTPRGCIHIPLHEMNFPN